MTKRRQRGQSLAEALIACTFVLIPIFLAVPLLGKYIDIKHQAVQSARYEAWEYTVWRDSNDLGRTSMASNFNALTRGQQPFKEAAATHREAENRFYGVLGTQPNDITRISNTQGLASRRLSTATTNPMWRNHRGEPLIGGRTTYTGNTNGATPTVSLFGINIGGLVNTAMDAVRLVANIFSGILSFLGNNDSAFTAINTNGLVDAKLSIPVRVHRDYVPTRTDLASNAVGAQTSLLPFTGKAAVLSEGWNSGGTSHTYNQANGTTPVTILKTLLDAPVLSQVWDVLAIFAPELTECTGPGDPNPPIGKTLANAIGFSALYNTFVPPNGSLWFGYVDGDVVHPDRLSPTERNLTERIGSHACAADGRCDWDATAMARANPARNLTPISHSPCQY